MSVGAASVHGQSGASDGEPSCGIPTPRDEDMDDDASLFTPCGEFGGSDEEAMAIGIGEVDLEVGDEAGGEGGGDEPDGIGEAGGVAAAALVPVVPAPMGAAGPPPTLVENGWLTYYQKAMGEVRFIVAWCGREEKHPPTASGTKCQISRSVVGNEFMSTSKQRSQGRPLGFLLAWLDLHFAEEDDTRWFHVHRGKPSLEQRQEARARASALPELIPFFPLERPRRSIANGDSYDEELEPEGPF